MWRIEMTDEYEAWVETLTAGERQSLIAGIEQLEVLGPRLGRPKVDTLDGSRHSNMKELRTPHAGRPIRSFFAFDPRRTAILLVGGDKTGDGRFYDRMIPVADDLFDVYLAELKAERLI